MTRSQIPQPVAGLDLEEDCVQPFLLETSGLRGRFVRLGPVIDEIIGRHDYVDPVAHLVADAVVIGGLLSGMLKFDGVFTLQIKGDGPVSMLIADVTSAGEIRAYAKADSSAADLAGGGQPYRLHPLAGEGYLAFTVDQGPEAQRYQGLVALQGETLADTVLHYFRQSEQLDTALRTAVRCGPDGWQAAGLLLQKVPDSEADQASAASNVEPDDWRRAVMLLATASDAEMLGEGTRQNELLYRLFHEERVRVFDRSAIRRGCRCSRGKVAGILASLSPQSVEEYLIDGAVEMVCEFCNEAFRFDRSELTDLFDAGAQS